MTPVEKWLPVVGWEDHYQVSNFGRVQSVPRTITDSNGHQRRLQGRLLRFGYHLQGYVHVSLCRDGRCKTLLVHQLVLTTFVGAAPEGTETCHNDGDPSNNCLDNLRYDTGSANQHDRIRHGHNALTNAYHCNRRHRFIPENLQARKNPNHRSCLACSRARAAMKQGRFAGDDIQAVSDWYFLEIMRAVGIKRLKFECENRTEMATDLIMRYLDPSPEETWK